MIKPFNSIIPMSMNTNYQGAGNKEEIKLVKFFN